MGKLKNKVKNFKGGIISRLYHDLLWIYRFYRNYLVRILAYIFIEILYMAVSFYITYRLGSFVDTIIEMNAKKTLLMGISFVGLFLLSLILSLTSNRFGSWNYNSMRSDLVKKLYNKLMHSDWEELTSYHTGDLITRLSSDAMKIAGNANGFLTTFISCTLMIIVSVGVIIINDVSMILVVLIVAPLIAISSRIFMNKVYECQAEIKVVESKENSYHKESFHNIQSVKAFGLADVFYKRIDALEKERYAADMRSNFFSLMSSGVTFIAGIVSGAICIGWAFFISVMQDHHDHYISL